MFVSAYNFYLLLVRLWLFLASFGLFASLCVHVVSCRDCSLHPKGRHLCVMLGFTMVI